MNTDTNPHPLTPADIEYLVESRVGMENTDDRC
jgi:hypothetical protein